MFTQLFNIGNHPDVSVTSGNNTECPNASAACDGLNRACTNHGNYCDGSTNHKYHGNTCQNLSS